MAELLLEIGVEEMPARFVPSLAEELKRLTAEELLEQRLDCGRLFGHATPRRLVLHVTGLATEQRREEEVVTGPPARIAFDESGELTKAGLGFASSQGVEPSDLRTIKTDKGEYLSVTKAVGGASALDMLPGILERVVRRLSFPKRMRWGSRDLAFGRPIRWLLALLDNDVVEFALEDIRTGRTTWGHRVMGPGPFEVADPAEYFLTMRERGAVVLDPEERKRLIRDKGDRLAEAEGLSIVWDDDLLDETANLVEYPRPMLGSFDELYLELPREVLLTSMQKHQKSLGVQDAEGGLANKFLTVLNLEPDDPGLVCSGWERVLKARLEDARFFWEADKSQSFDVWFGKLDSVTFLQPLGSMGEKARRLERLGGKLAEQVKPELLLDMGESGRLAKCDLVSEMVCEFDNLQGIMGGIYAGLKGYSANIAQALSEQYLPAGPDSSVPSSLPGALLSIADKADTLAGCFGLNMIPTGGADQYALRRQALGICRIVLEHRLKLDLRHLIKTAFNGYSDVEWKLSPDEAQERLVEFFGQRLKAHYTARGFETLVVEACLGAGFDDIHAFGRRLRALDEFSRSPGFQEAVLTFKRAANIIRKQGDEAGVALIGSYDPALFEEEAERELAAALEAVTPRFEEHWEKGDFRNLFALLGELRPKVDAFFDNVMVMCPEDDLRRNRLGLLQSLVSLLARLADFNALQV
ncbi:glycine--tRNA ligase subunit beta [Desulfohalovibrio reitneri]|uniref:glycine--tRNA ligase subunit beta n=1 Tax=Desulfohalovibrio reitneri TaxID=1307759 RepID=UPI0004A781C6|nr:glycine--tRNA ligase subunit beta [Desulfohalovibrio reitneri]